MAQERTPLLAASVAAGPDAVPPVSTRPTPLPKAQVAVLGAIRMLDPLALFIVLPLAPRMVRDFRPDLSETELGYVSGWIEACFALAQVLTTFAWGALSDHIGVKPVLLLGCIGVGLSMFALGLSTSMGAIIACRAASGALSGTRAFTIFTLTGAIGSSLGPLIGALLAHPEERWPSLGDTVLARYPYLAPCAFAGGSSLVLAGLGLAVLQDPKPQAQTSADIKFVTPLRQLFTRSVIAVLIAQAAVMCASNSLLALVPLYASTSLRFGGLGLDLDAIGTAFLVRMVFGTARKSLQIVCFPALVARSSMIGVYRRWTTPGYLVLPFIWPLAASLIRSGRSGVGMATFYAAMVLWAWCNMCFTTLNIVMSHSARSRGDLGRMHGVMQTSSGIVRTVSPYVASYAWALTADRHMLAGYLVYAVLLLPGLAAVLAGTRLREQTPAWQR